MNRTATALFAPDSADSADLARAPLVLPPPADRYARVQQTLTQTKKAEPRGAYQHDNCHRQNALLVIADIPDVAVEPLNRLIREMAHPPQGDLEVDGCVPFLELQTVHFARVLVHPRPDPDDDRVKHGRNQPPISAQLVFGTDFDGPLPAHLDELVKVAEPGLRRLFQHCSEWLKHPEVRKFILAHLQPAHTEFVGAPGRSVHQIRREDDLRAHLQPLLEDHRAAGATSALAIWRNIRQALAADPAWSWAVHPIAELPRPPWWVRALSARWAKLPTQILGGLAWARVALPLLAAAGGLWIYGAWAGHWWGCWSGAAVVGALLLVLGWLAFSYLGHLSERDAVIIHRDASETRKLVADEDHVIQNQMSSVIFVKRPLWFRKAILRGVLNLSSMSSKWVFLEGKLGKIESIHFARWALVDGGRRLLFFSNFDGSWESYLGEFVDREHAGLTSVWSNCVGFPRTSYLSGGGAADEERFKAYSRASQVPTGVWYSAYKNLTVDNINQNSRIRLGLTRDLCDEVEARRWLALL
jgi:hypothetical protein